MWERNILSMNYSYLLLFIGAQLLTLIFPAGASPRPPGRPAGRSATRHGRQARTSRPANVSSRKLVYADCGMDEDRPIRILNVSALPMPVRAPGKLKLAASLNVTETLPTTLGVDVSISKFFLGIPFKIPCYKNIGTCHYKDICSMAESYWAGERCPRMLRRRDIPCRCPFTAGVHSLNRFSVQIPRLGGILEMLAKGEYEARIRIYDETDKRELGCLQVNFHMRKRRRKSRDRQMDSSSPVFL